MNSKKLFNDEISKKIWTQYFRRVKYFTRGLPHKQNGDLQLEIQDHLYESFKNEIGDSEADRLINAIENIGDPEEYIKPMVTDIFLSTASKTLNPKTIVKGLFSYLTQSTKNFLVSLFFFMGYGMVIMLGFISIFKVFFPDNVGFFLSETGFPSIGIIGNNTDVQADILGYWIIPVAAVLSIFLYYLLTKKLRILKKT